MSRQGVAILIIIILIIVVGGVALAFLRSPYSSAGTSGAPSPVTGVCTMDAKMCPDGSYVGRIPPSCEFAACPGPGGTVSPSPTSQLPSGSSPIRLETHLNAVSSVGGISINPTSVLEDSRCPADVQCIQAGTVRIQTSILTNGGTSSTVFILDGSPVVINNISFQLVDVLPAKMASKQITPSDYRFIFSVSQVNGSGTPTGH